MQPSSNSTDPIDAQALDRLRELDPTGATRLLERVVAAYLTSLERLLPELEAAREPCDFRTLRQVSHTLKSSSASLGALVLAGHCASVETLARDEQIEGLSASVDAMLAELQRVRAALHQPPFAQP